MALLFLILSLVICTLKLRIVSYSFWTKIPKSSYCDQVTDLWKRYNRYFQGNKICLLFMQNTFIWNMTCHKSMNLSATFFKEMIVWAISTLISHFLLPISDFFHELNWILIPNMEKRYCFTLLHTLLLTTDQQILLVNYKSSATQIFILRNIYSPEKQENIFEKYVLKVNIKPSRKNKDFVF